MTLTQLEYVLSLNKHRNFKKAAEACHITQPTLSMQVQKLEEDLGLIPGQSYVTFVQDGDNIVIKKVSISIA